MGVVNISFPFTRRYIIHYQVDDSERDRASSFTSLTSGEKSGSDDILR